MYPTESTGIFSNTGHCYHHVPRLIVDLILHVPNLIPEVTALRWDVWIN